MTLIPEDKIAEICDRTDIVQLVSGFVALKPSGGGNHKGLCPFHEERTPSFNVNAHRQIFHCFGCQKSGNAIRFLMELERRDFMDVVRDLAERAGVNLPARDAKAQLLLQKRDDERSVLLHALEEACRFFEGELQGAGGKAASDYIASRGLSDKTRSAFRLGYAPNRWDALLSHFAKRGIPTNVARAAGLLGHSDGPSGERCFDFFRDRVMLPIIDRGGHVIAFGSRLLDPEAKERKYVNSPETLVFQKKTQVYGLHAAKDAMRLQGRAVLVEGNFDVLSLHEAGIVSAIAPMGTALTEDQLRLIARFSKQVVVVFDGDAAGRAAVIRAAPLFARSELDVRVAVLQSDASKIDPDEFVRKHGAESFSKLVDTARPALEHFLNGVAEAAEPSIPGRVSALASACDVLAAIRDSSTRDLYAAHFAGKLRVPVATVVKAIVEHADPRKRKDLAREIAQPPIVQAVKPRAVAREELEILRQVTRFRDIVGDEREVLLTLIADDELRELVQGALLGKSETDLIELATPELQSRVASCFFEDPTTDADAAGRAYREAFDQLRLRAVERKISGLADIMGRASTMGESMTEQLRELAQLKLERQELKEKRRSPR